MDHPIDSRKQQPEAVPPPMPGIAPREDTIDPDSPDAKSVAPSDGTGLSGEVAIVQPPHDDGHSWMQDA